MHVNLYVLCTLMLNQIRRQFYLRDDEWDAFVAANVPEQTKTIHFILQGVHDYYVTVYDAEGSECAGYERRTVGPRLVRCLAEYTPGMMLLPGDFLQDIWHNNFTIRCDNLTFNVLHKRVKPFEDKPVRMNGLTGDGWVGFGMTVGVEVGQRLVFTNLLNHNISVIVIGEDGVGLNREDIRYTMMRRFSQRKPLYRDKYDTRMQQFCNWPNHVDHVDEDHVFYTLFCAYVTDGFKLKVVPSEVVVDKDDETLVFVFDEALHVGDGIKVRAYCPVGKTEKGKLALSISVKSINVPDFSGETMENYGLITYREVELLHDDLHSAAENTQRLSLAVTHEVRQHGLEHGLSSLNVSSIVAWRLANLFGHVVPFCHTGCLDLLFSLADWMSLDEEKNVKEPKGRPAREWRKEEYCDKLVRKRKKNKKKQGRESSTHNLNNNNWWKKYDEMYFDNRKKKMSKSTSRGSKGSVDWWLDGFSGELWRARHNSHASIKAMIQQPRIPSSGLMTGSDVLIRANESEQNQSIAMISYYASSSELAQLPPLPMEYSPLPHLVSGPIGKRGPIYAEQWLITFQMLGQLGLPVKI
nr:DNA-binding pseudobarrel domain-containing protein [Tanacetum cinerariifolium]